jgi:uncharacterized membrane protein
MTWSSAVDARPPRALRAGLWLVQLLLAAAFALVGYLHAAAPIAASAAHAPWVASLPVAMVRTIGVAELTGALGLLLPAATRIRPTLTPLAAAGLAALMALAIPFHLMRGETGAIGINLLLGTLAALVVWGRTTRAPIRPRS